MRPRPNSFNGRPLVDEHMTLVDTKRNREGKSSENKSLRKWFGFNEARDESESSYTSSDSHSEEISKWSSHQTEFSECFKTDGLIESSSALVFDRDIQTRHRKACKQMKVSTWN